MENAANEETGDGKRVPRLRTILISVAVSYLNILRFLNAESRFNLTRKIGGYSDWNELNKIDKVTQISYVVVGILSFVTYAFLFQKCSRKILLYSVCISQFATSVLQLCTNTYLMLHLSRASSAVSDVGTGMFCLIYVSEIAPDEIRGTLVAIPELNISFNILFSVLMNFLSVPSTEYGSWISMYISAIVAIMNYAIIPESPIYFLRRDNTTGAKHSLTVLHGNDKNASRVIANRKKILKATRSDSQTSTSVFRECISRQAVIFTCIIIALYFSRITVVSLEPHFQEAVTHWYRIDFVHLYLIKLFAKVLGNLLGVTLCDRVGRKTLLLFSIFFCSIFLIATGFPILGSTKNVSNADQYLLSSYATSLVILGVYIFIYNLGVSILPEVLITDIFSPKILNIQMAILGSFQLCVQYFYVPFITILEYPYNMHGYFWLYGVLMFVVGLLMIKFLPETKCRPPGFKFMDCEDRVLFSSLREAEE